MLSRTRFIVSLIATSLVTCSTLTAEPVDFYFETNLVYPADTANPILTTIHRKSLASDESSAIITTEDQLDWVTTSPNGASLALFLVAHDSAKTSRILFTDSDGKTRFESKDTENILEPGFFSQSGNLYATLIGDPAGNHVGGPANYRIDVIDVAAQSRKTVFETIKPTERPAGWFRDSVQTLDWWIRTVQWVDENTLLLVSFTGLQVLDVAQAIVTDSINIPMYCPKSMRVSISPNGHYILYGPCPDPETDSPQMVYDLINRRNVTELMSKSMLGGDVANAIVKAKWLGGAPNSLVIEMIPRRNTTANPETGGASRPSLRVVDVRSLKVSAQQLDSDYHVESYSRTIHLPANCPVMLNAGEYVLFDPESIQ